MSRPIAFDLTHLVSRLPVVHPSGIDKVDMAYAAHFAEAECATAVHYGFRHARFHHGRDVGLVYELASRARWAGGDAATDEVLTKIRARLRAETSEHGAVRRTSPSSALTSKEAAQRRLEQIRWRFRASTAALPDGSIYLNVAQHAFEYPRFFDWLNARPDVVTTFLVHDLLPLDYPEYFRPGYESRFAKRLDTILRHARALITTSKVVADRLASAFEAHGRKPVPTHIEPLPSTLPHPPASELADAGLASVPYFVILGTIEPRKNHLLLLNVWRRMAEDGANPPKLIVIGTRGWENEQVVDVLDRSVLVRPHVIEASGLGDRALATLIANARGLLMPSFAEGYGLPVVEALSLGTPVIAADIPVFREVAQQRAIFVSPIDGPGWRRAVQALADASSPEAHKARAAALDFAAPTWSTYMSGVQKFLAGL